MGFQSRKTFVVKPTFINFNLKHIKKKKKKILTELNIQTFL